MECYRAAPLLGGLAALSFAAVAEAATVGKSVIVHSDADAFKTQPTGNLGARVACGVTAKS